MSCKMEDVWNEKLHYKNQTVLEFKHSFGKLEVNILPVEDPEIFLTDESNQICLRLSEFFEIVGKVMAHSMTPDELNKRAQGVNNE